MTWQEAASDGFRSAEQLLELGHYRSCVSRAYFAMYASCTHRLIEMGYRDFGRSRPNPGHGQMLDMLENNVLGSDCSAVTVRRTMAQARMVQRGRITADYVPGQTIDRVIARNMVRASAAVLRVLGIRES